MISFIISAFCTSISCCTLVFCIKCLFRILSLDNPFSTLQLWWSFPQWHSEQKPEFSQCLQKYIRGGSSYNSNFISYLSGTWANLAYLLLFHFPASPAGFCPACLTLSLSVLCLDAVSLISVWVTPSQIAILGSVKVFPDSVHLLCIPLCFSTMQHSCLIWHVSLLHLPSLDRFHEDRESACFLHSIISRASHIAGCMTFVFNIVPSV